MAAAGLNAWPRSLIRFWRLPASSPATLPFEVIRLDEVRADVFVSINGRENERLVDPEVDLAAACNNLAHKPESTDRGRQVSVLQWPKGAPLNLG